MLAEERRGDGDHFLVGPETAAASALTGVITDPRTLGIAYPEVHEPEHPRTLPDMFVAPLPAERARQIQLERAPNIQPLPALEPLANSLDVPVLLIAVDDLQRAIRDPEPIELEDYTRGFRIRAAHDLSPRQIEVLLAGGLIPLVRRRLGKAA